MTAFIYSTTVTSFLILALSIIGLVWLIGILKKDKSIKRSAVLAWIVPLVVISFIDIVICMTIIIMLPGAPHRVEASDGTYGDKIMVQWEPSSGAKTYHVLRATSVKGPYVEIAGALTRTSFVDTSAGEGRFYYKIVASNETGSGMQSRMDPGNKSITDFEFFRLYQANEKSGFGKLKKLGGLGRETEPGYAGGTISYDARFDGRAHVVSSFADYADATESGGTRLVLNGTMNTETDMLGNGTMTGKVTITGEYSGYVRYNLVIGNRQKSGGYYAVSQSGGKETVVPWNFQ